jgi:glycosyltransferase involved in cell wall biosynthesis
MSARQGFIWSGHGRFSRDTTPVVCATMSETALRRPRALFAMEQQVGHRSYYENVRAAVELDGRLDARFLEVTYEVELSGIERLLDHVPGLGGGLRGRAQIRPEVSASGVDVAFFNTQVAAVLGGRATRRHPYVLATDISPLQYDAMAAHYGHDTSRAWPPAWFRHSATTRVLQGADAIVPWSSWVARSLVEDYDVDPARVDVVPTGVDLRRWTPRVERAPGPFRILFVGGDWKRKGGDLVVDAWNGLPIGSATLDIVTRDDIDVPGATIHRTLTPNSPALIDLFRQADAFVLPSRAEAYGHVLVEAMAAGVPCIVSPSGAMPELVSDGVTGFVVPSDDSDAIGDRLLRLSTDESMADQMRLAARQRAEQRHDADANGRRIVDHLLRAALAERAASRPVVRSSDPEIPRHTAPRPQVLFVTDRLPGTTSGYSIRVANVVAGLQRVGDVHAFVVDQSRLGEQPEPGTFASFTVVPGLAPSRARKLLRMFSRYPSGVHFRNNAQIREELARVTEAQSFDLVWCSRARLHGVAGTSMTRPLVVDLDDLNDRLLVSKVRVRLGRSRSPGAALHSGWDLVDAVRWRLFQRNILKRADAVLVCSEDDRRYLRNDAVEVAPNGYPDPDAAPNDLGDKEPVTTSIPSGPNLLFVGPLTYEPNRLGVEWLAKEVLPVIRRTRPDVRLLVVGERRGVSVDLGPADHGAGVTLLGRLPDLNAAFDAASIAVAPIHAGGGTRLKVIEAMARRTPLVSTTFGQLGLGLIDGEHVLIGDTPEQFAAQCLRLLDDPDLADRLVAAARSIYEVRHSSEAAIERIRSIASAVVATR